MWFGLLKGLVQMVIFQLLM